MADQNKEILKCLQSIEEFLPASFPSDEYTRTVSKYGRKKLVETLTVLIESGFRQNRAGKWEMDNTLK